MEELILNILTYLLVAIAMFIAGKKMLGTLFVKKQKSACDSGCGGCATQCEMKNISAK